MRIQIFSWTLQNALDLLLGSSEQRKLQRIVILFCCRGEKNLIHAAENLSKNPFWYHKTQDNWGFAVLALIRCIEDEPFNPHPHAVSLQDTETTKFQEKQLKV